MRVDSQLMQDGGLQVASNLAGESEESIGILTELAGEGADLEL